MKTDLEGDTPEIRVGVDHIDFNELFALYEQVGLVAGLAKRGERDRIEVAFRSSYRVVTAHVKGKLVGAGRMLSDGEAYGMVFDVGILPQYQRMGIGKTLMAALLRGAEHLSIHLTSTFGNEPFYRKLGFKRHKNAFAKYPGHSSPYLIEE